MAASRSNPSNRLEMRDLAEMKKDRIIQQQQPEKVDLFACTSHAERNGGWVRRELRAAVAGVENR
jgi:hypothetical protein